MSDIINEVAASSRLSGICPGTDTCQNRIAEQAEHITALKTSLAAANERADRLAAALEVLCESSAQVLDNRSVHPFSSDELVCIESKDADKLTREYDKARAALAAHKEIRRK